MSLLDEYMELCRYIDKTTENDGYGGVETVWHEGATFKAAITLDTSTVARMAEAEGAKNLYTITTPRTITLAVGEIVRRESDQKLFRVTSDGTDKKTPLSASIDMRVVTAEQLVKGLPGGTE